MGGGIFLTLKRDKFNPLKAKERERERELE
jgi:hypothetical protein